MNTQRSRGVWFAFALLIADLSASPIGGHAFNASPGHETARVPLRGPDGGQQLTGLPSTEEIERDLLAAINKERSDRNLPVLRLSRALVELARRHSVEMAARNMTISSVRRLY